MRRVHPDDEVLAALALDDPDVAEPERDHLTRCPRCRAEVEELRRVRALAATGPPDLGTERPGDQVWDSVLRRVSPEAADRPPATATPGTGDDGRPGRRLAVALLAVACLALGGVVGRWSASPSEEPAPTPTVEVASAELDTLTGDQQVGTATVSRTGTRTDLVLSLESEDAAGGYLEVWLLDRDLERMVSVGVVGDTWSPSFTIPQRLLDRGYVVVDVSRQSFDGGPAHSGDSLMRGTLEGSSVQG